MLLNIKSNHFKNIICAFKKWFGRNKLAKIYRLFSMAGEERFNHTIDPGLFLGNLKPNFYSLLT